MAELFKDVESTEEKVLPIDRDDYHVYIRTNIRRIDEEDFDELVEGKHCWVYDEEVLTHSEYITRLEEQIARQEEANISTMLGLAELYEALYAEEEV